jgi:hypothetical protein
VSAAARPVSGGATGRASPAKRVTRDSGGADSAVLELRARILAGQPLQSDADLRIALREVAELERRLRAQPPEKFTEGSVTRPPTSSAGELRVWMLAVACAEMGTEGLSEHTRLELSAAWWRGRREGRPVPLAKGEPVPGCGCEACGGVEPSSVGKVTGADGKPPAGPVNFSEPAGARPRRDLRPALDLDRARAVPVAEVAQRFGLSLTRTLRNGDAFARCFAHDDRTPSLHLNAKKNAAFCNPCARRWDPIALAMALGGLSFPAAVKELSR